MLTVLLTDHQYPPQAETGVLARGALAQAKGYFGEKKAVYYLNVTECVKDHLIK